MLRPSRFARAVAAALAPCVLASSCNSVTPPPRSQSGPGVTVRHRLLLRDNPVDPGEASRCYGRCQEAKTPGEYLECLATCPGYEETDGEYCSKSEVPPVAACITVRRIPEQEEPPPGYVVLAVVAGFALIAATASLCASSSTRCGADYPPPR
jgi:hypothetical protein